MYKRQEAKAAIIRATREPRSWRVAKIDDTLGLCHATLARHEKASKCLHSALETKETTLGHGSPHVVETLIRIARAHAMGEGRVVDAAQCLARAAGITARPPPHFPTGHDRVAAHVALGQGRICLARSQLQEAVRHLEWAKSVFDAVLPPHHTDAAIACLAASTAGGLHHRRALEDAGSLFPAWIAL